MRGPQASGKEAHTIKPEVTFSAICMPVKMSKYLQSTQGGEDSNSKDSAILEKPGLRKRLSNPSASSENDIRTHPDFPARALRLAKAREVSAARVPPISVSKESRPNHQTWLEFIVQCNLSSCVLKGIHGIKSSPGIQPKPSLLTKRKVELT